MSGQDIKELAAQKRYHAKRLFGEVLERGGWANTDFPMARFVDAVIDAAILEIASIHQEAMKNKKGEI